MPTKINFSLKTAAMAILVLLLFAAAAHLAAILQTRYMLVSPIIPESVVWDVCRPHLTAAIILTLTALADLVFYFFRKYLWVIAIGVAALVGTALLMMV